MVTKVDHKNLTSETAEKLMNKNPNRIPVLITHLHNDLQIKKTKFLVPHELTMGQMQYVFRKYIDKLDSSQSIFIFVTKRNILVPASLIIKHAYEEYKDEGYLKLQISRENTFG